MGKVLTGGKKKTGKEVAKLGKRLRLQRNCLATALRSGPTYTIGL